MTYPDLCPRRECEGTLTRVYGRERLEQHRRRWIPIPGVRFCTRCFRTVTDSDHVVEGNSLAILVLEAQSGDPVLMKSMLAETALPISELALVSSVQEARPLIQSKSWDLILSDYELDESNGLDFIDEMREELDDTPVILISGLSVPDLDLEALERGASLFLQKQSLTSRRLERSILIALTTSRRHEDSWIYSGGI